MTERRKATAPSVFSYVVVNDSGFAPNPFHGFCTLACCKPVIRRTAKVGDMVVGLSSGCERIVYAMQVGEMLTFAEYWNDERYACKQPDMQSDDLIEKQGDNIYRPIGRNKFEQRDSRHFARDRKRDLSGRHVLVSKDFVYFGDQAPECPASLGFLHIQRGHRRVTDAREVALVARWFKKQARGLIGEPAKWKRSTEGPPRRPSCA